MIQHTAIKARLYKADWGARHTWAQLDFIIFELIRVSLRGWCLVIFTLSDQKWSLLLSEENRLIRDEVIGEVYLMEHIPRCLVCIVSYFAAEPWSLRVLNWRSLVLD